MNTSQQQQGDVYGDDQAMVDVERSGRILDEGDDFGDIPEINYATNKCFRRALLFGGGMVVVFALLIVLIQTTYGNTEARGTVIDDAPYSAASNHGKQGCWFGDRFDNRGDEEHTVRVYPGQYICSVNQTNDDAEQHRYQFGINQHGDLIINDIMVDRSVSDGYHQVFFLNPRSQDMVQGDYYFYLDTDGTFVVQNGDTPAWTLKPMADIPMVPSKNCYDGHDCPSLHVRSDGELNIVYMNNKQEVKFRSVHTVYNIPNQQGCWLGDRFGNIGDDEHNSRLYPGQYICSENRTNDDIEQHRYQFGINHHGDLIINDSLVDLSVSDGYHQVFFLNPHSQDMVQGNYYFYLDTDGTFVVQNGDEPAWTLKPKEHVPMVPSKKCFDGRDCPSLHVRPDGDLNIVYMNNKEEVKFRSVHDVYHVPEVNNHSLEPQNGRNGGSNKHEHPDN